MSQPEVAHAQCGGRVVMVTVIHSKEIQRVNYQFVETGPGADTASCRWQLTDLTVLSLFLCPGEKFQFENNSLSSSGVRWIQHTSTSAGAFDLLTSADLTGGVRCSRGKANWLQGDQAATRLTAVTNEWFQKLLWEMMLTNDMFSLESGPSPFTWESFRLC